MKTKSAPVPTPIVLSTKKLPVNDNELQILHHILRSWVTTPPLLKNYSTINGLASFQTKNIFLHALAYYSMSVVVVNALRP
jgi:hypothetical protein